MKNNNRIYACLSAGLIALLSSACIQPINKNMETADTAMLLDRSAIPTQHGLIRLQERPVFRIDAEKRPFAMMDDLSDKTRENGKPLTVRELKPK